MDNLTWLHRHVRSHLSDAPEGQRAKGSPGGGSLALATTDMPGTRALDLVEQAADLLRNIEEQAQQFESRARALAEGAIQKLHLAEDTIRVLRDDQAAAEARIVQLQDELEELREALKRELVRAESAENRLPQLEMRARIAETRAEVCENRLAQIEEAIRTKLLREGRSAHQKAA